METHLSEDSLIQVDEKRLEITFMREKCREKKLEKCVEIYDKRLNISNTSLLMLLDFTLIVTHVLLLIFTVDTLDYVRVDIFIYLFTMVMNLLLLTTNYNYKLKQKRPYLVLAANVAVVLIMVFRDVLVMGYHYFAEEIYTYPSYNHIVIILIYIIFPFEGFIVPITMAIIATIIITANVLALQLLNKKDSSILLLSVFHFSLHFMGISYRYFREYFIRRCVLTRCKLVEDQLLLKLVMAREKAMLRTLIPRDFLKSMRHTMQHRSGWQGLNKPMRTLFIQSHNNVTILNADIVNYTKWTANVNVKTLVEILHEIFFKFDIAAEEHNVQPIKFLGDAFICVSGIPITTPMHAKCCVDLGLQMIDSLREISEKYNVDLQVRIGVHSGELLSGIIGTTKWQYDVWSKDVDIAIRLEHFGVPGFVHISEQTYQLLDDLYICDVVTHETLADPILQKYQMVTYLVKGLRNPDDGYPSLGFRDSLTSTRLVEIHSTFADSYNFTRNEVRAFALQKMYEEVENMPIGRIQLTRIFDFSDQPDRTKCEDYEFQQKISPWFMFFRKRSDEWRYMNQPDELLKYQVVVATLVSYAIIFESAHNTTFQTTYGYFILLGFLTTVCCFIVIYKKLWLYFISKSPWDRPNNPISLLLYKTSEMTRKLLIARIIVYFFYIGATFAMCSLQMVNCRLKEFELQTIEAQLADNPNPPNCFFTSVYTQSIVMIVMLSFTFADIPVIIKLGVTIIIMASLLASILGKYGFIFERDTRTNPGFRSEYAHCWYVIAVLLLLYTMERKKMFISKIQFYANKKRLHKQIQTQMSIKSIKFILSNILPVHVAEIYFSNKKGNELFTEEFSLIAVMFASITNYDAELAGILALNDIICQFDDMLYKYNGRVEKIKVAGWTYMAACGLDQPDPVHIENTESLTSSKIIDLRGTQSNIRFSTKDIVVDDSSSSSDTSSEDIAENENVKVMRMTSFALDLFRAMHEIASKNDMYADVGLRVGIAFGPVVAGVVGRSKPHYDIWGHTVNIASRLESSGLNNTIQVTKSTALILQDFNILCHLRSTLDIKGIGKVPIYTVAIDENLKFIKYDPYEETPLILNTSLYSGLSTLSIDLDSNKTLNMDSESNASDSDSESSMSTKSIPQK